MIINKLETYEICDKVLKVYHYKVNEAVVIIFDDKEKAKEYASYFNGMRYIHAESDGASIIIRSRNTERVRISTVFINKTDDNTILNIKRY